MFEMFFLKIILNANKTTINFLRLFYVRKDLRISRKYFIFNAIKIPILFMLILIECALKIRDRLTNHPLNNKSYFRS